MDWKSVCELLPPCSCIGYDLPGHGNSSFMEDFTIDIPRFHLIGYSMGGRLSLMYQAKHPEQVASLTLMSTHPGLKTEKEKEDRFKSDAIWAEKLLTLPIEEFLHLWYEQSVFKPFRPDFSTRSKQNILDLAKSLMHYSLAKQPLFEIDTMLVGIRDTKFHSLAKNPISIPNAGHAVHLENPKCVAEYIRHQLLV